MAKKIKQIFLSVISIMSLWTLTACNAPALSVLSGNLSYSNGKYQKSILSYLMTIDSLQNGLDVVHYNLGNTYYALGEGPAALQAWNQAEGNTNSIDTLFRIAFNRGVLYYNWGHYDEAYRSFRRALELNPMDIDTKINLEDSLSRIRLELPLPASPAGQKEPDPGINRMLEYLKRKEARTWSDVNSAPVETVEDW